MLLTYRMFMFETTKEWLNHNLVEVDEKDRIPVLCQSREWVPVSSFRQCGSIFAIYKDSKEYCVHAGDEWKENEEPLLGYYNLELSWDDLVSSIADKYDSIRNKVTERNESLLVGTITPF